MYRSAAPFSHMTPSTPRIPESACLPYRGRPEKTPLWSEWRPWPGEAVAGHFWTDGLEEALAELHKQGDLHRVKKRGHKAELPRLTCTLSKGENLVLWQRPEHAGELAACCGLSTCVEPALQQLLRQKRRAPTHEERTEAYRRQDGKCGHCSGELDDEEEFDHPVPVRDAVEGQPALWRCWCKPCRALLSDREVTRRNPLLSSLAPPV